MTEIDFEELDKAVNSMMADVGKTDSPASVASSNTSTTPAVPVARSPDTSASNSTVALSVNNDRVKPSSSPLPTKRRGQFMDIVRPTGSKPTTIPSHRQGVTIAPSATATSVADTAVEAPAITSTSFVSAEPFESTGKTSSVNATVEYSSTDASEPEVVSEREWPDPIDFANYNQQSQNIDTSTANEEPGEVPSAETPESESSSLDSPFLPDAKPEKRPLGALVNTEESGTSAVDVSATSLTAELSEPMATTISFPAEFHDNVVAIESESTTQSTRESDVVESTTSGEENPAMTVEMPKIVEPQPPAEVLAGGAIPQQYKEQLNTGDQTSGSIYDTANYHMAIEAHATGGKKTAALKMVVWGLLLLVLGAGVGAGIFMFTR